MSSFLISFIASALFTLLIIKRAHLHEAALDSDLTGVQKVHAEAVPRIGGAGIFMSVVLTSAMAMVRTPLIGQGILLLLLCSGIAFLGGIVEDFTKNVSPGRRLGLTMAAAALGYFLLDARIEYTQHVGNNDVTWFLLAKNLLNEDIRMSTSLLKDISPLPGRNFVFGVRTRF